MTEEKPKPQESEAGRRLTVNSVASCSIDLPTFGAVHVAPYINVGTILALEEKFPEHEPTATELVDTLFACRAEVEGNAGELRKVTPDEVAKLTEEDRVTFARSFLSLIRSEEKGSEDDSESPVESLAAYILAEWRETQKSSKEIAAMVNAGFSEKTVNLFREGQTLAERVIAATKLPGLAEVAKHQSLMKRLGDHGDLLNSLNSPAMKAVLRLRETPKWQSVIDLTESPAAKAARQLEHTRMGSVGCVAGRVETNEATKPIESVIRDRSSKIASVPVIKSGEQVMIEQLGKLKEELGQRLDKVGDAAVDIALQQDKTNSTIMSALVDIRNKWKDDQISSRNSLLLAGFSLLVSAILTAVGVVQDYLNNKEGDKYQEQVTQLLTQQKELMEQQRQLLEQLSKTNKPDMHLAMPTPAGNK